MRVTRVCKFASKELREVLAVTRRGTGRFTQFFILHIGQGSLCLPSNVAVIINYYFDFVKGPNTWQELQDHVTPSSESQPGA